MWLVSTFEKIYLKKIFFVSTFLDWYSCAHCKAKCMAQSGQLRI